MALLAAQRSGLVLADQGVKSALLGDYFYQAKSSSDLNGADCAEEAKLHWCSAIARDGPVGLGLV